MPSWRGESFRLDELTVAIGDSATIPHECSRDACTCGTHDAFEESKHPRGEGGEFTTVYHGTSSEYLPSIKEQGLKPGGAGRRFGLPDHYEGERAGQVFLAAHPSIANRYAAGATGIGHHPVTLKVKIPKEHIHNLKEDPYATLAHQYKGNIPKEWISHDAENLNLRIDKSEVAYSPADGSSDRCSCCSHYSSGTCELVAGDIDPNYWCRLFVPKQARRGVVGLWPDDDDDGDTNDAAFEEGKHPREEESDAKVNPADVATVNIPLLIRLLEYAREDASDDEALHFCVERLIDRAKTGQVLTMADYDEIVGQSVNPDDDDDTDDRAMKVRDNTPRRRPHIHVHI